MTRPIDRHPTDTHPSVRRSGRRAFFETLGVTLAVGAGLPLIESGVLGMGAHAQSPDALDAVLAQIVSRGLVDYTKLAADPALKGRLDAYVASLAALPASAGLADHLNAYNAIVLARVAARWPLRSVRDVPGFFDRQTTTVAGSARTLDALENDVIRGRFRDARVHAALVCGAVSCPTLHPRAFRAASLDATLTQLTRQMVASRRHVDPRPDGLHLSELFFWFEADFVRDAGSVRAFLDRYDAGGRLAAVPADARLVRIPYRWAVNASPAR